MAINVFYRGKNFIKNYMVKYLNSIFLAAEKDQLLLTDGTKHIEFSRRPQVVRAGGWDSRNMPAVLIMDATGNFDYMTFSKDRVLDESNDDTGEYRYVGGAIDLSINISVRARSIIECDNLADIVALYLAHPVAKDYFNQHGITLPTPPRLGNESVIFEPKIDYPIYATAISMATHSQWQEKSDLEDRLLDIITDVTLVEEI